MPRPPPRLPFAAVASPTGELLVERRFRTGNAADIAAKIVGRLIADEARGVDGKRSYSMGSDGFAYRLMWGSSGYTFLILERGLGDAAVWRLLGAARLRWEALYGSGLVDGPVAPSAAAPFEAVLSELMRAELAAAEQRAADEAADDDAAELGELARTCENVKSVMADSIEKVLERGEKIEMLVDRAERLETNAIKFSKSSVSLKRSMRWRALRWRLGLAAAGCGALMLALGSSCGGWSLSYCRALLWASSSAADGFTQV